MRWSFLRFALRNPEFPNSRSFENIVLSPFPQFVLGDSRTLDYPGPPRFYSERNSARLALAPNRFRGARELEDAIIARIPGAVHYHKRSIRGTRHGETVNRHVPDFPRSPFPAGN